MTAKFLVISVSYYLLVILLCQTVLGSSPDTLVPSGQQVPVSYNDVANFLKKTTRPTVRMDIFDLSSSTPFCDNSTVPENALDEIEPECNRWEEQELDMLLMYMDLLAVGMDETLAKKFYREIRCLSRKHVRAIPHLHAWEVCFKYDYSELVGNLLGSYVKEDLELTEGETTLATSARFSSYSWSRSSFLRNLFRDSSAYRIYQGPRLKTETSCCVSCFYSHYFVNLESGQCTREPFGKHCCHNACKSLGRLKIGAASSTSFCCKRCVPMPCRR